MNEKPAGIHEASRAALFVNQALGETPAMERLAALRREPILIAVGPSYASTRRGQLMLAVAANIVGRLFEFAPAIDVDAGASRVQRGIPGLRAGRPLAAAVVSFLDSLGGEPDRYRYRPAAGAGSYGAALLVGDARPPSGVREAVWIDGEAWTARAGPEPRPLAERPAGPFNPFGPLIAAALGAAEVAKSVFRRLSPPGRAAAFAGVRETITWDLWRHEFSSPQPAPPLPTGVDLGRFAVAGLGALGSAAVLALSQVEGGRGSVELIDDDRLSASNLERVLTARAADVGLEKVGVAARLLRGTRLRPRPVAARYGASAPAGSRAGTILVGVDSGAARRQIMNLLPRAVYNGGTHGAELLVSRHVGLEGPCLECLYPETDNRVSHLARQLGIDAATAAALVSGERRLDRDVLDAMDARGGARFPGLDPRALIGQPLAALEASVCSRAVVIDELPEATISFVSALCGFLMALEFVKDRVRGRRPDPLDPARPALRHDALAAVPGPGCVERYVPRRDCFCQDAATRRRFAALEGRP